MPRFNGIVVLGTILYCLGVACGNTIRYCLPSITFHTRAANEICETIGKEPRDLQCVKADDRLECFLLLIQGKADFMIAMPEDLQIMKSLGGSDIVVTHQLQKHSIGRPDADVEMIVLVKKNKSVNGTYTTKGQKLCYPGLESSESIKHSYYYTSLFERYLFPENCRSDRHLLENRVASLSSHFSAACIAGPWSFDYTIDQELKRKYKNLCALCSNPKSCSEYDRYYEMNGAMSCLKYGHGNLAWLNRASFKGQLGKLASKDYYLLCPDGQLANLKLVDYKNACSWIADRKSVILSKKIVSDVIRRKFNATESSKFDKVISTSYRFHWARELDKPVDIVSYLDKFPGYMVNVTTTRSTCSPRRFGWCVTENEARKCRAIQRAAEVFEVKPRFNCVVMTSREEAIEAVITGKCDVFVAKPSEMKTARKSGAKALLDVLQNSNEDSNAVVAIVKRKSQYYKFEDLKNAKACFTGYRSVGWNAFLSVLQNQSARMDCNDVKTVSNYFKESCVIGFDESNEDIPKNLYSLCKKIDKNSTVDEKAFQCLMNGADVAFVNVVAAKLYALRKKQFFNEEYRLLSANGKHSYNYYIGKSTLGSIIVNENMTEVRKNDIYLAFLKLDNLFGVNFNQETHMLDMYESFEGTNNLIFPNTTVKLAKAMPGIYGENLNLSDDLYCVSAGHEQHRNLFLLVAAVLFHTLYSRKL